jgi:hypothetical protein
VRVITLGTVVLSWSKATKDLTDESPPLRHDSSSS